MPPKGTSSKPPLPSASKTLITTGRKDVVSKDPSRLAKRTESGQKPSTERALVLRNGKFGARGTGELMVSKKMSGREKLDLLAEDLLAKSKKALARPFKLEDALKIAESQADVYVDDISHLRDADVFFGLITAELKARMDPTREEPRRNPTYVAKAVATRIHNSYMLASAWKLVSDTLNELVIDGLPNSNIKTRLKNDPALRERYLVVYDLVKVLVRMGQDRFSLFATTTPHYAKYFKLKPTESSDPGEPEYVFDWKDLRGAATSFLDSIIIELCFPGSPYPKPILYQILHDSVQEAPREAKRFSQSLWDAVGDLSSSVDLEEILEAPLLGPEGEIWKQEPRNMPEEYDDWVDAQILSGKATDIVSNFKDVISPLEKTRRQSVVDNMWKYININYQSTSGQTIDQLWQMEGVLDDAPQWHAYKLSAVSEDSDEERPPGLVAIRPKNKNGQPKKVAALTNGYDSYEDMPELQSVSNTSEEEGDSDSDSDDYEGSDGYDTKEDSEYDEDHEEEIRDFLREAMDTAHEADFFDAGNNMPADIDPFKQEDRKGNPFLKLLGSLRGRMFSANPKLKTTTRTEPRTSTVRSAFRATPSGTPKEVPKTMPPKPATAPSAPPPPSSAAPPKSQRATVEEVEDEGDVSVTKKKKKKKTKKKKKLSSPEIPSASPSIPVQDIPTLTTSAALKETLQQTTTSSAKKAPQAPTVVSQPPASLKSASLGGMTANASSVSLPLGPEFAPSHAQSARSYIQSLGVSKEKKVKSRPDHASLFSNDEPEKKGFLSKLSIKKKTADPESEMKEANQSWLSGLGKKAGGLMHQLLSNSPETKGPMKWENFLKVMRDMGFSYDPSTAGSSVRFDPPDKRDKPITFHKPHPDSTIRPDLLRVFSKRLKRHYGWKEEYLLKHAE